MIDVPYEVKHALKDGRLKKNYRVIVLNDDGTEDFTIDNETLVYETVNIDERLCSGDVLKFGLCEGSSIEFQYFNHPNIYGRRIQVFVDVEHVPYSISTTITGTDYESYIIPNNGSYKVVIPANQTTGLYIYCYTDDETIRGYVPISSETQELVLGQISEGDQLTITTEYLGESFSVSLDETKTHTSIPMGFFDVKKCSRQASTGIMKVTAYNKLMSEYLDAKANDNDAIEYYWGSFDREVTVFELLNALLQGYAVEPDFQEITGTHPSHGQAITTMGSIHPTSVSFNMASYYGIDTPMSFYEWKKVLPSWQAPVLPNNMHPEIITKLVQFNTTKDFRIFKSLMGKMEQFERTVYDRLVYEYDRAGFVDSNNNHVTGESIVASFDVSFQRIIGAVSSVPIQNGSWYGYRNTYYSTIRYEYEEANGIPHERPIEHFPGEYDRTYKLSELFVDLVPDNITLYVPWAFGVFTGTSSDIEYSIDFAIDGINRLYSNTYRYYTDNSQTTYEEKTLDGMVTPSGDSYNAYEVYAEAFEVDASELDETYLIKVTPSDLPDFTLRELQSAVFETICQFGQLSRTTDLFEGVELNNGGLYPAEDLYPANDLYPSGASLSATKAMYSQLWADEGNKRKWRYLIITYKGLDEEDNEADFTLQRTVNADGTDDYNMSDNWLFRNLVWTAEDVGDYADAMVAKMQNNEWFPFEMWCAGLPYLETGDQIEIPLNGEVYKSYILQRQLKGIQNLQDTYINGTLDIF